MFVSLREHLWRPSGDVLALSLMFKQLPCDAWQILMYEKTCLIPISIIHLVVLEKKMSLDGP